MSGCNSGASAFYIPSGEDVYIVSTTAVDTDGDGSVDTIESTYNTGAPGPSWPIPECCPIQVPEGTAIADAPAPTNPDGQILYDDAGNVLAVAVGGVWVEAPAGCVCPVVVDAPADPTVPPAAPADPTQVQEVYYVDSATGVTLVEWIWDPAAGIWTAPASACNCVVVTADPADPTVPPAAPPADPTQPGVEYYIDTNTGDILVEWVWDPPALAWYAAAPASCNCPVVVADPAEPASPPTDPALPGEVYLDNGDGTVTLIWVWDPANNVWLAADSAACPCPVIYDEASSTFVTAPQDPNGAPIVPHLAADPCNNHLTLDANGCFRIRERPRFISGIAGGGQEEMDLNPGGTIASSSWNLDVCNPSTCEWGAADFTVNILTPFAAFPEGWLVSFLVVMKSPFVTVLGEDWIDTRGNTAPEILSVFENSSFSAPVAIAPGDCATVEVCIQAQVLVQGAPAPNWLISQLTLAASGWTAI
jgi:hypothetical protein